MKQVVVPAGMALLKQVLVLAGMALFFLSGGVSFADLPPRYPNSQKYRESGVKPATGRSGSASIQARALLGADGTTQVEISTGQLDAANAPGNISKVQLKLQGGSGTWTRNFNNLKQGGYVRLPQPGLLSGQSLQIQTNVTGIDPKRTDVVTVATTVALGPDPAVTSLDAPAQTPPDVPVIILSTVRELNGATGARADCLMAVDGEQVDQSLGIWVDAGDAVTCGFAHTFSDIGRHRIRVWLSNVAPSDYDSTNNEAEADIEVLNRGDAFSSYWATANETETRSFSRQWSSLRSSTMESYSLFQSAILQGSIGGLQLDRANASVEHWMDDEVVSQIALDLQPGTWQSGNGSSSGCFFDMRDFHWFQICGTWSADGQGSASLTTGRLAGEVTFHSEGWDKTILNPDGSYYTFNFDFEQISGTPVRFGSIYEMRVSLSDGSRTFAANPSMELQRREERFEQPAECVTALDGTSQCSEWNSYTLTVSGSKQEPN
jgi:hypothetical protein